MSRSSSTTKILCMVEGATADGCRVSRFCGPRAAQLILLREHTHLMLKEYETQIESNIVYRHDRHFASGAPGRQRVSIQTVCQHAASRNAAARLARRAAGSFSAYAVFRAAELVSQRL